MTKSHLKKLTLPFGHELVYLDLALSELTAALAHGFPVVCPFVNDILNRRVLTELAQGGTKVIALRCAGYNNVDMACVRELGMRVVHVPAYSPHAVAEHAMALILSLNRKVNRAHNRVRDANFALDGLLGFDLVNKVAGVIGTGKIGAIMTRILAGFGCRTLAYDVQENVEVKTHGAQYVPFDVLIRESDIITLHCPLVPATHHLINAHTMQQMKDGVMLINTSRGGLIDTRATIRALKTGKIAYLGLDVYEEEANLFFRDLSGTVIQDDIFARLLTFPNVLITSHQAFFYQRGA